MVDPKTPLVELLQILTQVILNKQIDNNNCHHLHMFIEETYTTKRYPPQHATEQDTQHATEQEGNSQQCPKKPIK
uniref:Uncharacterized protein n=1 Tax=viral metagenome TaxID=1070528 RepID=A0A6H1ZUB9_9ZZZZ